MLIKMMYELIIESAIGINNEVKIEDCVLFATATIVMLPFELILLPMDIIGGIIYFCIKRGKKR